MLAYKRENRAFLAPLCSTCVFACGFSFADVKRFWVLDFRML